MKNEILVNSNLKDGLNFASKFTWKKGKNLGKILGSYYLSKILRKPIHFGLPISISVEPTTSCNLRCPECPSGLRSFTRPTGMLQDGVYKALIDELEDTLLYLLLYFQGEPYLHPHFFELIHYASKKKIYTSTSTNAHYLSDENAKKTVESGLDRLIISIDGTTQETYSAYRKGGNLEKVIEGTKRVLYWKKVLKSSTPHVVFQFLVVKPNEHQIDDLKTLAEELGVEEVGLKTAQIYGYKNGSPLIPTIDQYARYKKQKDGTYSIKNKLVNHCWKMWHSCVITWNGSIVPCCFDKDAKHQLGSLKSASFQSIWGSTDYRQFRASILKGRDQIEICKNCTEGTKVWA